MGWAWACCRADKGGGSSKGRQSFTYSVCPNDEAAKWIFNKPIKKSKAGSIFGKDLVQLCAVEFLVVFDYQVRPS
jgi:hypothetical protein